MDAAEVRARFGRARVARLATVRPNGHPHLVPCCFALVGNAIYSAVDAKPKSTLALQRLANIRAHPAVTLLVDHYADDWRELWWVRVDGPARVLDAAATRLDHEERERAVAALQAKYRQYRADRPSGAVLAIAADRWQGWSYDAADPSRRSTP